MRDREVNTGKIWSREISLGKLRESHRAAYLFIAGITWILMGIFMLLFLLLVLSALNPWVHARVIISGSMEPTIKTGSMVIVVRRGEYRQGDIIAFQDPMIGRNVHRIVGEASSGGVTYYTTKGDASMMPDRFPVPGDRIEGKVVAIFPYLGYAAYSGFFAALVPLTLAAIHILRKRRSRSRAGEGG
ncbi:MAG: signal peptidase I [Actinobacteria bacterium]|nr:signal peptidase I [Actinomycetota bacterium]